MRLGKKPVSCIPCAKRKVKCDRLQPCCHCRRRPNDQCVYPTSSETSNSQLESQAERIRQLEQYVQELKRDLRHIPEGADEENGDSAMHQDGIRAEADQARGRRRQAEGIKTRPKEAPKRTNPNDHGASKLISQEDGENYIES